MRKSIFYEMNLRIRIKKDGKRRSVILVLFNFDELFRSLYEQEGLRDFAGPMQDANEIAYAT